VLTLRALALAVFAVGCTSFGATPPETAAPTGTSDYRPSQLRLTAVAVRIAISPNADISETEDRSLPGLYEGTLVEGLNERALVVRDVRLTATREPPAEAAARAREVGADHAVVIDVRIEPDIVRVCEDTSRPLQGRATVFKQQAKVVRASDGVVRSTLEVNVPAVEVDCDARRPTARSQSASTTVTSAVERLLARLLRP
jgi:hypothetical protein